ncbi:TetR/AcrR family transcriptional regulator [Nocardioides sp. ChNu-153]|uniref:TetR/AcrR family transcriptional regulator n=1 Tax=unclassified Nocardioides TaxID=2615069 RepID=UPI0024060610|nr:MULTISPECIES: TetR/AcrR family transcriptional regulator [unclassified Nocardioides]MDF9717281.1 TetR/AcrR family transcriptional regulator [Nocardioides sp. ChNu-99]MDN7120503.1 TetR/AcrR family transcriptional regulator [Nocardioides sp. ChNu-153]
MTETPDRGAQPETSASTGPERAPSRRDRARLATTDEIKAAARELLAPAQEGSDLSLRAVAREVGMTPSAIYRYFESRHDLMEALALDAFDSVAAALGEAAAVPDRAPLQRAVDMAHAYRAWCLRHPAEFALIFRHGNVSGAGSPTWREHLLGFYRVPLVIMLEDVAAGHVALGTMATPLPVVQPEILEVAQALGPDGVCPEAVVRLTQVWASIHGFVCLELFGHAGLIMGDVAEAFEHHVRTVLGTHYR